MGFICSWINVLPVSMLSYQRKLNTEKNHHSVASHCDVWECTLECMQPQRNEACTQVNQGWNWLEMVIAWQTKRTSTPKTCDGRKGIWGTLIMICVPDMWPFHQNWQFCIVRNKGWYFHVVHSCLLFPTERHYSIHLLNGCSVRYWNATKENE